MTIITRGIFGTALAAELAQLAPPAQHPALYLSGAPDLALLRQLQKQHMAVYAVFLLERYVVLSPILRRDQGCADCFVRRFVSAPPAPYSVEFVEAAITASAHNPDFEYRAFLPSTVRLVAELMSQGMRQQSTLAYIYDQFGTLHQSAPLLALHGCQCRRTGAGSIAGPQRFITELIGVLP